MIESRVYSQICLTHRRKAAETRKGIDCGRRDSPKHLARPSRVEQARWNDSVHGNITTVSMQSSIPFEIVIWIAEARTGSVAGTYCRPGVHAGLSGALTMSFFSPVHGASLGTRMPHEWGGAWRGRAVPGVNAGPEKSCCIWLLSQTAPILLPPDSCERSALFALSHRLFTRCTTRSPRRNSPAAAVRSWDGPCC